MDRRSSGNCHQEVKPQTTKYLASSHQPSSQRRWQETQSRERKSSKLTDEARTGLAYLIDVKDTSLQSLREDTQKDADKRRQRYQNTIFRKTMPVIAKIAKGKNLSVVQLMDESRDAYIDDSLIITDEVIKAYNLAYPVAATQSTPIKK